MPHSFLSKDNAWSQKLKTTATALSYLGPVAGGVAVTAGATALPTLLGVAATVVGMGCIAGIQSSVGYLTSSRLESDVRVIQSELRALEEEAKRMNEEIDAFVAEINALGDSAVIGPRAAKHTLHKGIRFGGALDAYTKRLDKVGSAVETTYQNVSQLRNFCQSLQTHRDKGLRALRQSGQTLNELDRMGRISLSHEARRYLP